MLTKLQDGVEQMYEEFKDLIAITTCFALGAGLTSVLFIWYFIPKRDEFKADLSKAELEKVKAQLDAERAQRKADLAVAIKDVEKQTQAELKVDPVDVVNKAVES